MLPFIRTAAPLSDTAPTLVSPSTSQSGRHTVDTDVISVSEYSQFKSALSACAPDALFSGSHAPSYGTALDTRQGENLLEGIYSTMVPQPSRHHNRRNSGAGLSTSTRSGRLNAAAHNANNNNNNNQLGTNAGGTLRDDSSRRPALAVTATHVSTYGVVATGYEDGSVVLTCFNPGSAEGGKCSTTSPHLPFTAKGTHQRYMERHVPLADIVCGADKGAVAGRTFSPENTLRGREVGRMVSCPVVALSSAPLDPHSSSSSVAYRSTAAEYCALAVAYRDAVFITALKFDISPVSPLSLHNSQKQRGGSAKALHQRQSALLHQQRICVEINSVQLQAGLAEAMKAADLETDCCGGGSGATTDSPSTTPRAAAGQGATGPTPRVASSHRHHKQHAGAATSLSPAAVGASAPAAISKDARVESVVLSPCLRYVSIGLSCPHPYVLVFALPPLLTTASATNTTTAACDPGTPVADGASSTAAKPAAPSSPHAPSSRTEEVCRMNPERLVTHCAYPKSHAKYNARLAASASGHPGSPLIGSPSGNASAGAEFSQPGSAGRVAAARQQPTPLAHVYARCVFLAEGGDMSSLPSSSHSRSLGFATAALLVVWENSCCYTRLPLKLLQPSLTTQLGLLAAATVLAARDGRPVIKKGGKNNSGEGTSKMTAKAAGRPVSPKQYTPRRSLVRTRSRVETLEDLASSSAALSLSSMRTVQHSLCPAPIHQVCVTAAGQVAVLGCEGGSLHVVDACRTIATASALPPPSYMRYVKSSHVAAVTAITACIVEECAPGHNKSGSSCPRHEAGLAVAVMAGVSWNDVSANHSDSFPATNGNLQRYSAAYVRIPLRLNGGARRAVCRYMMGLPSSVCGGLHLAPLPFYLLFLSSPQLLSAYALDTSFSHLEEDAGVAHTGQTTGSAGSGQAMSLAAPSAPSPTNFASVLNRGEPCSLVWDVGFNAVVGALPLSLIAASDLGDANSGNPLGASVVMPAKPQQHLPLQPACTFTEDTQQPRIVWVQTSNMAGAAHFSGDSPMLVTHAALSTSSRAVLDKTTCVARAVSARGQDCSAGAPSASAILPSSGIHAMSWPVRGLIQGLCPLVYACYSGMPLDVVAWVLSIIPPADRADCAKVGGLDLSQAPGHAIQKVTATVGSSASPLRSVTLNTVAAISPSTAVLPTSPRSATKQQQQQHNSTKVSARPSKGGRLPAVGAHDAEEYPAAWVEGLCATADVRREQLIQVLDRLR